MMNGSRLCEGLADNTLSVPPWQGKYMGLTRFLRSIVFPCVTKRSGQLRESGAGNGKSSSGGGDALTGILQGRDSKQSTKFDSLPCNA